LLEFRWDIFDNHKTIPPTTPMNCKYHPERKAEFFCTSCNAPLCRDCVEMSAAGEPYCYECAMLHSLTAVGTTLKQRKDKEQQRKDKEQKRRGPFGYFVIVSCVLIAVMWGVILFGKNPAPPASAELAGKERVLLFMVDGALKRYALYQGNTYPAALSDLLPDYLSLRTGETGLLTRLSYQKDPTLGYRLRLSNPGPGEMNLILTPKGIEYTAPGSTGA
jgi:hypothetical protein